MKVRIDQKQLADAARRAHRLLPSKPLMPVLAGLLLQAGDGHITVSGFDLDTSTRASLAADTLQPGETLVSGHLLAGVAAAMPPGPVDLVADDREITVSAPGTTFTLPTMDRHDYPALPAPPGINGTIDGDLFAAAVTHAATAVLPPDEAVGSMEACPGVHVAANGDRLTVSATDRYRIVRYTLDWQPSQDGDGELTILGTALAATTKQLAGHKVRLGFPGAGGGVAALSSDTLTVTSRTIAAPYPNLERFFPDPDKCTGWALVEAAELKAAATRAGLVNDTEADPINLAFAEDLVVVSGGKGGSSGSTSVGIESDGLDGFGISYRPGFLASLLAPIDGQVRIRFTTPKKPALIEPVDDDTYRAVCMPVRPQ
ncbi:DNA polymerase III subunit beta [Streptomyces longwoodensis]|uniref:DNA polymerase III subunit beta n=1 Tax=Streptomyces longwoodensis TaxID=68231 RepID=UPI0037F9C0D5